MGWGWVHCSRRWGSVVPVPVQTSTTKRYMSFNVAAEILGFHKIWIKAYRQSDVAEVN